jgi:hypothetical protein
MLTMTTLREKEMSTEMSTMRTQLDRLWRANRPLTATGLVMLVVFAASVVAMAVDRTQILGAPTWLKPAKFAISSATYAFTLAWIFTFLPERARLTTIVGRITAAVLVIEVGLIDLQAARGVTSHFNAATTLDAVLFSTMGAAILVLWGSAIAVTVAVIRQRFADETFGWALRIGMLVTVLGQATGGFMTTPTHAQLAAARTTRMTVAGAHTVGAPDGGPGVPITGWSREHGDLRVPHFVGLHAAQLLPAIVWLVGPLGSAVRRRRALVVSAGGYLGLFAILLAQALSGQSLLAPRGAIAIAFVAWGVALMLGSLFVLAVRANGANSGAMPVMVSR